MLKLIMIKLIKDEEYLDLLSLYLSMYKCIKPSWSKTIVASILSNEIQRPGYRAYGIYKKDKLIGFVAGHNDNSQDTWFCTGLYCSIPLYVKRLLLFVRQDLQTVGYKECTAEVHYNFETSVMPKLGGKIDYIKYRGEL